MPNRKIFGVLYLICENETAEPRIEKASSFHTFISYSICPLLMAILLCTKYDTFQTTFLWINPLHLSFIQTLDWWMLPEQSKGYVIAICMCARIRKWCYFLSKCTSIYVDNGSNSMNDEAKNWLIYNMSFVHFSPYWLTASKTNLLSIHRLSGTVQFSHYIGYFNAFIVTHEHHSHLFLARDLHSTQTSSHHISSVCGSLWLEWVFHFDHC